jgi:hypothetical protein
MYWNRRRSAFALLAATAALAVGPAFAKNPSSRHDDDDDDNDTFPNLFISPCGEPFRAPIGAPYPVVDWFHQANKSNDGKLSHDEFIADADAFFKRLDLNGDGMLSRYEIHIYERKMVPEIIAGPVTVVGQNGGARLWLAQYGPPPGGNGSSLPGGGAANTSIDPAGDNHPDASVPEKHKPLDESGQGASPYGFFEEPEPLMTADFNVDGVILRDNYLKVAEMHFTALDSDQRGYLTLKTLPKTAIQKLIEKTRHDRRRS